MHDSFLATGNFSRRSRASRIAVLLFIAELVVLCSAAAPANAQTNYVVYSNPTSLVFSYTIGGSAPAAQNVTINDTTPNALPFTVSADQSWITTSATASKTKAVLQFGVNPSGLSPGVHTGHIFITAGIVVNSPLAIPVSLTVTAASGMPVISATPNSASFGDVIMGQSSTQTINLTNTGSATLTISQVTATGAGMSVSIANSSASANVGVQQTITLAIKFAPTSLGAVTGNVSVMSNATNSPAMIPVSGTGVQSATNYTISVKPSSFVFSYKIGAVAPPTQSATINDTTPHALPFTVSTDQPWITTSATASKTKAVLQFGVNPTGLAAGIYSGHIIITAGIVSNSPLGVPIVLTVTGGASSPGTLSANPAILAFGNVNVGNSATETTLITNTGGSAVTISQLGVTGAGITASGIPPQLTLNAGQTTVLSVMFTPPGPGALNGSASVMSDATNPTLTIAATGTGVQPQLTANPTSFNFGNVNVNSTGSKTFTVSNSGSSSLTITQSGISGNGFTMTGMAAPMTLAAGATTSFSVQFAPLIPGSTSGTVTLTSNSPNSPTMIGLTGTGVSLVSHSVALSWTASSSTVSGYNVYVSSTSGGPYTLLNSGLVAGTSFTDSTVQSGNTYFYVVTAVDANGVESIFSNEFTAVVP